MAQLFFILLSLITLNIQAQDEELKTVAPYILQGQWKGKLTQLVGGIAKEYDFEISLKLNGDIISGTGVLKAGNNYGNFEISGKLEGTSVSLEDVKITNKNIRQNADWCIKKMPLKFLFRASAFRLEGPWSGYSEYGSCKPGQIFLKKESIRA